jgi:hypothetical protein
MVDKNKVNLSVKASNKIPPGEEKGFFADVSAILAEGRSKAYTAVNYAAIETKLECPGP